MDWFDVRDSFHSIKTVLFPTGLPRIFGGGDPGAAMENKNKHFMKKKIFFFILHE